MADSAEAITPGSGHLEQMVISLPGTWDPSLAIAAARGGAIGLLDLTQVPDAATALQATQRLCRQASGRFGLVVEAERPEIYQAVCAVIPEDAPVVIDHGDRTALDACVARLRPRPAQLGLVVRAADDAVAADTLGFSFLLAKGHEGGGLVGELTSYVLLQVLRRQTALPIFVWGGIGRQGAAACVAGGAAGIVLDWQLALTRESPLPPALKWRIARMDGSETAAVSTHAGTWVRVYHQPGFTARDALDALALQLRTASDAPAQLRTALRSWMQAPAIEQRPWLVGQDAAFASQLAPSGQSVARVLESVRLHVEDALPRCVAAAQALAKGSPMARSQGTDYPVMQGAMTRVSDIASFCDAVERGGALPMLALALMHAKDAQALLEETAAVMGTRSWGVGVLGFVERELRLEQLAVVERIHPPYVVIAGGRPDQSAALEAKGIHTYLHVPSPAMLDAFLKEGARRFIFEGFECGGHVGPRSSLVLWESMVDVLSRASLSPEEAAKVHVYFAGGIHDAHSAAMACALAQPIIARGMKFGVEMGTAYLFTHEAVATGAIVPRFQQVAIEARHTVLAETGPGHAIRCAPTDFYADFENERARLKAEGRGNEEIRHRLEEHNMGRLRIASKAVARGAPRPDGHPTYVPVDEARQSREGMYMIGQVAAMHTGLRSIRQMHAEVCDDGARYLERMAEQPVMLPQPPAQAADAPPPLDIAIVGMACLLPGAEDPATLWDNILGKRNALSEIPADRFDLTRWFDGKVGARDRIYSRMGGFIADVPFDPLKFGIPPASLPSIEPAQLLALEVVDRALRDAGHQGLTEHFPQKERTSVILGVGGGMGDLGAQYSMRAIMPGFLERIDESLWSQLPEWTEDSFAGILLNVVAGRVSNKFDLGGVNFTVDAACASSLAAIYLACRELADGTSDMVVTGGVDTVQNAFGYLCFSSARALTAGDKPRVFDAAADGIVISEGLAAVVLKRRADAERDGDRIYAVLRAVAGGSDGRSKSMTAPRFEGQLRTLNRAYAQARIDPATVGLFEAHGTGTALGDRTEAQSVTELLRRHGTAPAAAAIGSVKSMIGHTKCTAGVAGMMKAALALYYRTLPPTIHVTQPNPQGGLQDGPLYVNTESRPWVRGAHRRRAGVSAFGFGGTNFHAVLEEYDGDARPESSRPVPRVRPAELFAFAAQTPEALAMAVQVALGRAQKVSAWSPPPDLANLALAMHQENAAIGPHRTAVVAGNLAELIVRLKQVQDALASGRALAADGVYFSPTPLAPSGKVAFLFPGQGSQHPNMLGQLALHFAEVSDTLAQADGLLAEALPQPISRFIHPPPPFTPAERKRAAEALTATQVAQPAIGACSVAMLRLLQRFGIQADLLAGHSYGELVALHAAQVMDAATLLRLSWARGQAMASLAANGSGDLGTMLAVKSDPATVAQTLQGMEQVWVANSNSPRQTVISGARSAIAAAAARFAERQIETAAIPVACAFHSPIVAPAQAAFGESLRAAAFAPPQTPVYSNVTADAYADSAAAIGDNLLRQIVSPVQFAESIRRMYAAGARVFVEVGPNQVLSRLVPQILGSEPHAAVATSVRDADEIGALLQALARLFAEGVALRLDPLYNGRDLRAVNFNAPPAPLAPHMMLVNGAYLRRASEPKRTCLPKATMNTLPPPSPPTAIAVTPVAALPPTVAPAPAVPAMAPDMMVQWQQTMQRFLETQQRVMQAYLGGSIAPAAPMVTQAPAMPVAPAPAMAALPPPTPAVAAALPSPPSSPAALPSPAPAVAASTLPAQLEKTLLGLVSDRTGYPTEMLNLDANLEADLGIDSIKRVEILTAFGKQLPQSGGDLAERLARAKSLREVLREAEGAAPAAAGAPVPAPAAPTPSAATGAPGASVGLDLAQLQKTLLGLVSDRTGYPVEMLDLNANLEADLGIDSIKRVEILTAFGKQLPQAGGDLAERLARAKSLNDVLREAAADAGSSETPPVAAPVAAPTAQAGANGSGVDRYVVRLQATALRSDGPLAIPAGVVIVTDDGGGIADIFQARLQELGGTCAVVSHQGQALPAKHRFLADLTSAAEATRVVDAMRTQYGRIGGVVHLSGLRASPAFGLLAPDAWQQAVDHEVKGFFHLLRATAPDLQAAPGAWVAAGINLGGELHGDALPAPTHPWRGGVIGLIKTVAVEWPQARTKVISTAIGNAGQIVGQMLAELAGVPAEPEVHYLQNQRWLPHPVPTALAARPALELDRNDVILAIGGARGITAEVARALAARHRCTFALAGRSPWPGDEPALTRDAADARAIKQCLFADAQRNGQPLAPLDLERACQRILMDREMRATRTALEAAGSVVAYFQGDAQNEDSMRGLLQAVKDKFRRLDGILCGAGQIEDKLIADKTPESFARVLDLKARAGFVLARVADPGSLKFLVLFSSIAGWVGNRGQADYVAANEILNRLALHLAASWQRRVVAIDWGPWEKRGMVTALVKEQFQSRGVGLVPVAAGAKFMVDELRFGRAADSLVLALGQTEP